MGRQLAAAARAIFASVTAEGLSPATAATWRRRRPGPINCLPEEGAQLVRQHVTLCFTSGFDVGRGINAGLVATPSRRRPRGTTPPIAARGCWTHSHQRLAINTNRAAASAPGVDPVVRFPGVETSAP